MAKTTCHTCGQPQAACPAPPPLPDTTGRVVELQADRARVCGWLGGLPGQHDPTVRAWVDAEMARARDADEPTIQAMLTQYRLVPRRRKGTGHYPTLAPFFQDVRPIIIEAWRRQRRYPSAEKVGAELPTPLSAKQLKRLVKQLSGLPWEQFLDAFFGLKG
jgi:hypothetical protein